MPITNSSHRHDIHVSTGNHDPYAHTMSLSEMPPHTHHVCAEISLDISVAFRFEQKAKEKGITLSTFLTQMLNEREEVDVACSRPPEEEIHKTT